MASDHMTVAALGRPFTLGMLYDARRDQLIPVKYSEPSFFTGVRVKQTRCNDSLEDNVVQQFPVIREELSTFQTLCGSYASKLQQVLAEKLPSIREGKEDESSLDQLFEDRDKSPFSQEKLTEWLDRKEREINIIRSCVDTMEGTKIVPNQTELDRVALAPGVEDVLVFVFTSVERGDTDLDVMADHLKHSKLGSTNEDPWFYSTEVNAKIKAKTEAFHNFAKGLKNNSQFRFLIATIANEKHKGATIYYYKNGILVTEDFKKLQLPPVETITDRRDLIFYACDLNLDPNTISNHLTLSEGNKKVKLGALQSYPNHPDRFEGFNQVLCKESLSGRHYWEVEWSVTSPQSICLMFVCGTIVRKVAKLNVKTDCNVWTFCQEFVDKTPHKLATYCNGNKSWDCPFPSDGCSRVGVYLDWPAGTLSFYRVSSNTLRHLYTFETTFPKPVKPGFRLKCQSNYVKLCPVK